MMGQMDDGSVGVFIEMVSLGSLDLRQRMRTAQVRRSCIELHASGLEFR